MCDAKCKSVFPALFIKMITFFYWVSIEWNRHHLSKNVCKKFLNRVWKHCALAKFVCSYICHWNLFLTNVGSFCKARETNAEFICSVWRISVHCALVSQTFSKFQLFCADSNFSLNSLLHYPYLFNNFVWKRVFAK